MSTILGVLRKLLSLLEEKNLPYMIIGGYALPFYGRVRATLDIDVAVMVEMEEELEKLRECLLSKNFNVELYSPRNPCFVVVDRESGVEVEVWLRPDGIVFDQETLKRRKRVKLDKDLEAWIVSPEDFIVNKLARPDRGTVDEQDVKSVLTRQKNSLDESYLKKRAKNAGVLKVLETIQKI
ncbi:MAG: nucleotidyltransferase [Candidatus Jordarchaeum sp.]|uniref:nucleotidyltransferase n=1 Tax=Candidatus Jordarchaeum sp. TaxID=2823881 RepID=UPI00404A3B82